MDKKKFYFMLNLLRENCSFNLEVIYTLCVTAKITFRHKSDSIEKIKTDLNFKRIQKYSKSIKNGYSFNVSYLSNAMKWHPLDTIAKLNQITQRHNGFLIKTGYGIYLKIHSKEESQNLKMKEVYEEMRTVLKFSVHKNLERKLRRLDLFYYILDQALRQFPEEHETNKRSQYVQRNIEKYFEMDEINFVTDHIGWDNLKKTLPLQFLSKKGKHKLKFLIKQQKV
jgi:CRISPR/Cas system CSM-associated protein Csm2 small subunit